MSKEIPLTRGKVALVDDDDYVWLLRLKWHVGWRDRRRRNGNEYFIAQANEKQNGKYKPVAMHRLIMARQLGDEEIKGYFVDHINGDPLDNRKCNLRLATPSQNKQNLHARLGATGYKGVTYHKQAKKWRAVITANRKHHSLGLHCTPEEAACAYDKAAREFFGEFANLNFPDKQEA